MRWTKTIKGIQPSVFQDWSGRRREFARRAYAAIQSGADQPLLLWEGDELVGICAIDWNYVRGYLFVDFIATKRKGYGTIIMRRLRNLARRRHYGVTLIAERGAWGFYRKLKMKEERLFTWKFNPRPNRNG